ncbi:PAS domain S-box protein [bacterium]|nr:PAS domain S-box protein [bacterium]MBU1989106.1 PAS domain S-box protein [bacterium]
MKKHYIFLLLSVVSAVFVAVFLVMKMEQYLYDTEMEKIELNHHGIEERLRDFVKEKDLFIKMISQHHAVRKSLSYDNGSDALEDTKIFFYNLVKGSEMIMQLRLLDTSGREFVRVDRTIAHDIVQIKEKDLQDKSQRDYFIKFSKLDENSVGFSSLDLNVENKKVEVPWRPTLRMGIPVFIDGRRVGMVVANYCMQHWLEDISKLTLNNFYLVDSDGYFISHPDEKWKWSRYQTPPKFFNQYFTQIKALKNDFSDIKRADNLFVKKMHFFNNETVFAVYEPKIPIDTLLFEKAVQVSGFIFIMLILVLVPVFGIIVFFIKNLNEERDNLKHSQNYIETIFNNAFDAIFVINRVGIIQKINLSAEKLFGYSESELLGKNINILVPEPDHSRHDGYIRNYKDDGHSTVIGAEREIHGLDKDQNLIPISLSVSKMELDGELSFVGSIRDYSQLKLAQDQQREQEAMLLQQSKFAAMGEMLSAIAHQWRQPLNSIGLIIQDLVSAEKYGELNSEYLQKSRDAMMSQVRLMSDTIDEFRNFFSKINVKKVFNIVDAIEELHHLYWAQFNANNITFELLCRDENGVLNVCDIKTQEARKGFTIEGLPSELKQILLNLIANAKDAIESIRDSDACQRKISLFLDVADDNIVIEVSDNAGGIDKETLQRIFEPYYTTKEMGTGLGLFIVKTLLDKHLKGTIECKNKESECNGVVYKGSVFCITLPKSLSVDSL